MRDKEEMRRLALDLAPVPAESSRRVTTALQRWLSPRLPGTVAGFLPMRGEVDVTALFDLLPGWRWVLPRVEDDGSLTFRPGEVGRERHRWGMLQPKASGPVIPVAEIDVLLVPGLVFDLSGARLGRGGGYYDRVLSMKRYDALSVGVTVEDRLLPVVPLDGHDVRVEWLATESGVRPPTR